MRRNCAMNSEMQIALLVHTEDYQHKLRLWTPNSVQASKSKPEIGYIIFFYFQKLIQFNNCKGKKTVYNFESYGKIFRLRRVCNSFTKAFKTIWQCSKLCPLLYYNFNNSPLIFVINRKALKQEWVVHVVCIYP